MEVFLFFIAVLDLRYMLDAKPSTLELCASRKNTPHASLKKKKDIYIYD